ncbi:flavin reductase family protein [Tenebrionicola larvae]|uniref:flavin reductase family protein n=1 Tax=Tenebrionicola larvae TaxID=2815733 RepID=UPI00295E3714|nr:flavin reductase [Tenebrionicola larvae]
MGNCSNSDINKFAAFGLTPSPSKFGGSPGIAECYACFECQIYDDIPADRYNFFIFEVVYAQVCRKPALPDTLHYRGDGQFRGDGERYNLKPWFAKVT